MCQKGAMALASTEGVLATHADLGIDNFDPAAGPVRGPEAKGYLPAGAPHRGEKRESEGQVGGGRGRERAARAVEFLAVSAASQTDHPTAVVVDVDEGTFHMAAFHEDRLRAEASDRAGRGLHRPDVADREAGEPLRFVAVRGEQGRPIEESVHEGRLEIVFLESGSDRRDHHGIHDERERGPTQLPCDGPDDRGGEEHAGLRRSDVEVVQHRAELLPDLRRGDREDRVHGPGVLGGHARDDGRPEDMESVDVLVEENLRELRSNRKPEGFNREGAMRMIFPISNQVEFYVYGRGKVLEVARVAESLSRILQKYRLKHTIEWDKLKFLADKKE